MGMIGLDLRARQQLALTPRLQQSVKLLQLSATEFEQALAQAIASNPFLEDGEPNESEAHTEQAQGLSTDDPVRGLDAGAPLQATEACAESELGAPSSLEERFEERHEERFDQEIQTDRAHHQVDPEDGDWPDWTETTTSLRDHLQEQLLGLRLSQRDQVLTQLLVDGLDDDGYLRQSFGDLALASDLSPPPEDDEFVAPLKLIQSMDPVGIGARDLAECLSLQLRAAEFAPETQVALAIVEHHLGTLARREFARLQQAIGCTEAMIRAAHARIRRLNPRPGAAFKACDVRFVVPDVIVRKHRQQWVTAINPAVLPNIRVNQRYADIFRRARDASHGQLGQQLQEARWLIRNTEQRFTTILRVAEAIVARQKNFLDYGDVAMKPLGLRHIADELELHESTISRATGNKYMSTPRGMFEFRHFFSRELDTDTGGTCSATAIRALLREMIAAEDHQAPLSDVRLADQLATQGIKVARRTVTKYRRLMQVPPVDLRRLH